MFLFADNSCIKNYGFWNALFQNQEVRSFKVISERSDVVIFVFYGKSYLQIPINITAAIKTVLYPSQIVHADRNMKAFSAQKFF